MTPDVRTGPRVSAILLAAGASTRLGQPKQLLSWQGRSLLRHTAMTALEAAFSPVVVVLGSHADAMAVELEGLAVVATVNPHWSDGMGSSLRFGLQVLTDLTESTLPETAVLVLLCDQPLVTPAYLRTMTERYAADPHLALASEYAPGILGPPCLFPAALFPTLRTLSGAQGARAVLKNLPPESLSRMPFPEGLVDVDTPEDWHRLTAAQL